MESRRGRPERPATVMGMKIKELIAAARGIRCRPEHGAVHAPLQSDEGRLSRGESSELTPEQADSNGPWW